MKKGSRLSGLLPFLHYSWTHLNDSRTSLNLETLLEHR